jgi:hypothetical protein
MAAKIKSYGESEREGKPQTVYCFHCPGCGYDHPFHVPAWKWNGSLDKPTFTPSLMCFGTMPEKRCHSYVTDGKIQFLVDSFHELRSKTVELPDWDDQHFE